MTTPPLKDILTEEDGASGALVMFLEAGKRDPAEQIRFRYPEECDPDVNPVQEMECAEPSAESSRDRVLTSYLVEVMHGLYSPFLDVINGLEKVVHLPLLTASESRIPLVVDASGDTEIAGELDLGNIRNSGVEVLGYPISIDVCEEV